MSDPQPGEGAKSEMKPTLAATLWANPWGWAENNPWKVLGALLALVFGGSAWISWASLKIDGLETSIADGRKETKEEIHKLDGKVDARFEKWEDRFWDMKDAKQANSQEVKIGTVGYDRGQAYRDYLAHKEKTDAAMHATGMPADRDGHGGGGGSDRVPPDGEGVARAGDCGRADGQGDALDAVESVRVRQPDDGDDEVPAAIGPDEEEPGAT